MEYYVKRAQNGDKQAFVALIEGTKQDLYKVAISYLHNEEDAADAIQETILICYEKLQTLKKPSYFKTWLIRILINQCIGMRREKKKYEEKENMEEVIGDSVDCYKREESEEFLKFIQDIDEKYTIILLLYYGEELKIKEIATILSLSENTVKTRLHRGRKEYEKRYRAVHKKLIVN